MAELKPIACGTRSSEDSWIEWQLFRTADIKAAYPEHFEPPEYVAGNPCPHCGGHVEKVSRWNRERFTCLECGAWLETEDDQKAALDREFGEAHYSGPGRGFNSSPFVRMGRTRTLVTVMGGLDI